MDDGRIYITISDTRENNAVGTQNSSVSSNNTSKEKITPEEALRIENLHRLEHSLVNNAQQIAMYSIGNIGNFTGNYQAQREVNTALNLGKKVAHLGMAMATGNPVIIATTLLADVVNIGLQEYSSYVENKKINYSIDRLRDISGLNTLKNGSR